MTAQQPSQGQHHRLRHYIIMTTVIIVGLFVILLFNNKSDSFGITSAVVENVRNSSLVESINNVRLGSNNGDTFQETERIVPNTNDIEFLLSSSAIPQIAKETRIDTLTIIFNDLATPITVNEDKLELTGLSEITLGIAGFRGTIEVDEAQFSLDGIAKKFEVNGISLSSTNEIKISFNGLNYQRAIINSAEFKDLEFVSGEGSIQVGSRLKYGLEDGQIITVYSYVGDLTINKAYSIVDLNSTIEDTSAQIQGFAKGIDVTNGALNLNLR